MFHRSERLLLRPVWPEDWPAIYAGINNELVVRNLARAPWPYSERDARSFAQSPIDPQSPRFLITECDTAAVVGCIGLDSVADPDALELGYWIAQPAWGKGYATEAGHAAIKMALMMGKSHLEAGFFLDNPASGRVLAKLGFVRLPKIAQRHSLGRGASVATAELRLELVDNAPEVRKAA